MSTNFIKIVNLFYFTLDNFWWFLVNYLNFSWFFKRIFLLNKSIEIRFKLCKLLFKCRVARPMFLFTFHIFSNFPRIYWNFSSIYFDFHSIHSTKNCKKIRKNSRKSLKICRNVPHLWVDVRRIFSDFSNIFPNFIRFNSLKVRNVGRPSSNVSLE